MKDPFVEEIRSIRMEHTRAMGSDMDRIMADIRAFEKELGDRVVFPPAKKPLEWSHRPDLIKHLA
jgi:hypothetical protein